MCTDGTLGISASIIVYDFYHKDESLAWADPSFAEEKKEKKHKLKK